MFILRFLDSLFFRNLDIIPVQKTYFDLNSPQINFQISGFNGFRRF